MQQSYSLATVKEVVSQQQLSSEEAVFTQEILVEFLDGQTDTLTIGTQFEPVAAGQLKTVGQKVIVYSVQTAPGEFQRAIADNYRLPTLFWLSMIFVVVIVAVGKKKGLLSLLGMFLSVVVLVGFIIPQILLGANPIVISLFGSLLIGSLTVYLSHGYNLKSHIALFSMMSSLAVVCALSFIAVQTATVFGLGSEEAAFLQVGDTASINLRGLLLGGIMLGALGVLDDVAVSQVSVVFQLRAVKQSISFFELYTRAIQVGRDHVASLVNTLVLAYAGANMPLFLLFSLNQEAPAWVIANSEVIVEEVIRTLSGSIGLVLAVPLTTLIAAKYALKLKKNELEKVATQHHEHGH